LYVSAIKANGVSPGEVESLRGERTVSVLTPLIDVTDRYLEQSLENEVRKVGVTKVTSRQTNLINIRRAQNSDELWRLNSGENP
jgi:hypothetical protein